MSTSPTPGPPTPPGLPEGYLERWMDRRRRRRRWALRILVVLLVASVAAAWGLWYTMHRHWMAASALELDGLSVQWELADGAWKHGGRTHVANTRWVWRPGDVSGEDLQRLADLHRVETLSLASCLDLTGDDLAVLGRLPHLKVLDLTMTRPHPSYDPSPLNDAMLDQLEGLDELEELNLVDVNITDTGLERFPSLPSLRFLDLTGTRITDRNLKVLLDRLPALETVALERTGVTRGGVEALWRERPGLIVLHPSTSELPQPID